MKLKTDSCSIEVGQNHFLDFSAAIGHLIISPWHYSGTIFIYWFYFCHIGRLMAMEGTYFMPSFDASGTACCCADQQLPDQIRAAWDCIVWCHFKIQEHFKIHFSHHSHLQRTQVHVGAFSSSSDGNGYMAGNFSESDED